MKRIVQKLLLYTTLWSIAFAASFVFLYVMGYGDTGDFKGSYTVYDFLSDGMVMVVFLSISLLFNHLFIRWFRPLQNYRYKLFLYSILLLATNTLMAVLITQGMIIIWGNLPRQEYIKTVYLFSLVATFISGIHANISFQENYKEQAEEAHRLEMENMRQREVNLQTSLMVLKTQVDPHFLFNNFSILSELIEENPNEARNFLDNLSRVYRYKLVNMNTQLVSIKNELRMLYSYVQLIETRFGTAIYVEFPTKEEITRVQSLGVPPLVVQMLVENAIKHNAHSVERPLVINVRINGHYVLVINPVFPLSSEVDSTGIGLPNLQERYRLLSTEQPIISNDGHNFTVTLPLLKFEA